MTHRYKLLYSPATLDSLVAVLERLQYSESVYYASFRTEAQVCGRPVDGLRKPRWFDAKRDPNQMWLPFEEYTPVRMYPPRYVQNDQWRCQFALAAGDYTAVVNLGDRERSRNSLQALEVYRREVAQGEPCDPFGRQMEDRLHRAGTQTGQWSTFRPFIESLQASTDFLRHIQRPILLRDVQQ